MCSGSVCTSSHLSPCVTVAELNKSRRTSPPSESRKWGVYYIVGLVIKSYFRVCALLCFDLTLNMHIYPGKNDSPLKEHSTCARGKQRHSAVVSVSKSSSGRLRYYSTKNQTQTIIQVTYWYYTGVIAFLNEDFAKVR